MVESRQETPFPQQVPHIFFDTAFDLIPEVCYKDLVHLSQVVKALGRENSYSSLADCLRKIQWAKIAGLEAITIEKSIEGKATEKDIPFYPIGQAQHSKAMFDFVAHLKAALDSVAVFLNDFLEISCEGGDRDFRKQVFYKKVCQKDCVIGNHLIELRQWLDKDSVTSDSIIATRDEWQHRGSPAITAMFPPVEIGYLPVPRALKGGFPSLDTPLTQEYYWTTREFIEFHFQKMSSLFNEVIKRCIELEISKLAKPIEPVGFEHPMSLFPMRGTRDTKPERLQVRMWTPVYFNVEEI